MKRATKPSPYEGRAGVGSCLVLEAAPLYPTGENMKKQVKPGLFFAIIAVFIVVMGLFMWRHFDNPYGSDSAEEARYRETEKWAKDNHVDLRADPMMAPLY